MRHLKSQYQTVFTWGTWSLFGIFIYRKFEIFLHEKLFSSLSILIFKGGVISDCIFNLFQSSAKWTKSPSVNILLYVEGRWFCYLWTENWKYWDLPTFKSFPVFNETSKMFENFQSSILNSYMKVTSEFFRNTVNFCKGNHCFDHF